MSCIAVETAAETANAAFAAAHSKSRIKIPTLKRLVVHGTMGTIKAGGRGTSQHYRRHGPTFATRQGCTICAPFPQYCVVLIRQRIGRKCNRGFRLSPRAAAARPLISAPVRTVVM